MDISCRAIFLYLLLGVHSLWGQDSLSIADSSALVLKYYPKVTIDGKSEPATMSILNPKIKIDSTSLRIGSRKIIQQLFAASYLTADIDRFHLSDSTATISISKGPLFEFGTLDIDSSSEAILAQAGYRTQNFNNKRIDMSEFSEMYDNVIKELENNGFPFASIGLRDYTIDDASLHGAIQIQKGRYIEMDTFNLYGLDHIDKQYLYHYLQIDPGDPYNAEKILAVKQNINNLNFVSLAEDPTIRFIGNKAILNLNLQQKNASRFDFILGVLPSNNGEQQFTITGEANFEIQNKLKQGEQLSLKIQSLKQATQRLDFNFKYPFIGPFPFGVDTEFHLFRNENKHRDLNFSFGILYQLGSNNFLKAFWNRNTSRLIEIDTAALLSTRTLPSRLDVATNNFGLEWNQQNLDYRFNPRKGYNIIFRTTAGQKQTIINETIRSIANENVDFANAYDTIDLSSIQFRIDAHAEYFIPIRNRSTLLVGVRASKLFSENTIYENEYNRIGGNQILRGFDEESISAEFFYVGTLEYRLLLTRNSFLSAFVDYGIRQNKYDQDYEWDQPYGAGAGFSLETGAGIFGINVAVGSQKGNPLDFRNIKTHMGFLGLF